MTAARILDRVQFGYGKAASKLGLPHTLYRPNGPGAPLASQNIMRALPFTTSQTPDGEFKRPSRYGAPVAFALIDVRGVGAAAVRVGDYVTGSTGVWFLASMEQLTIPMVVECNAVINVVRAAGVDLAHEDIYGGRTDGTDGTVLTGWPASVLQGGRIEVGRAGLPGDPSMKGYIVLLPAQAGALIRTSDRMIVTRWLATGENPDMAMVVNQAELTALGWRIGTSMGEA